MALILNHTNDKEKIKTSVRVQQHTNMYCTPTHPTTHIHTHTRSQNHIHHTRHTHTDTFLVKLGWSISITATIWRHPIIIGSNEFILFFLFSTRMTVTHFVPTMIIELCVERLTLSKRLQKHHGDPFCGHHCRSQFCSYSDAVQQLKPLTLYTWYTKMG